MFLLPKYVSGADKPGKERIGSAITYQVVTGLLVIGLIGGELMSKLYFPGDVSCRSLPVP